MPTLPELPGVLSQQRLSITNMWRWVTKQDSWATNRAIGHFVRIFQALYEVSHKFVRYLSGMRKKSHNTESQDFRRKFKLSQKVIANYLGISGSLFGMFERGKRELKPQVFDKLMVLQEMLMDSVKAAGETVAPASIRPQLDKHRKTLAAKLRSDAKYQQEEMVVLKRRLTSLCVEISQYTQWMNVIEVTLASLPSTNSAKAARMWFDIRLDEVSEKLSTASKKRLEMEVRIGLLEVLTIANENQYRKLIKD